VPILRWLIQWRYIAPEVLLGVWGERRFVRVGRTVPFALSSNVT